MNVCNGDVCTLPYDVLDVPPQLVLHLRVSGQAVQSEEEGV